MIGLIFGTTDLPKYILKRIKKKKKYLIIDLTKNKIFKKEKHCFSVSLGQFGKIINILKKINVRKFYLQEKLRNQNFQIYVWILKEFIICQELSRVLN